MAFQVLGGKATYDIIVGGYGRGRGWGRPNYAGPTGTDWGVRDPIRGYSQNFRNQSLVDIEYYNSQGTRIKIYRVRSSDAAMIDRTMDLIPPEHLEWLLAHKPEGILIANEAGRGRSARYTGGLNPIYDDPSTPYFDESRGIMITYGAIWRNRDLGIVPSIFHELGHVLTRQSRISYRHFSDSRSEELSNTQVSRNSGSLEALCNAYQYMLCYGSTDSSIRAFGTGYGSQKDATTRAGLRGCPAFTSMLSEEWRARFAER